MSQDYDGPEPTRWLHEFTDELLEAAVGDEFDIVGWIEPERRSAFFVGRDFAVAQAGDGKYLSVVCVIQPGTMLGHYEEDDTYFVRLLLKVKSVTSTPNLKVV